MTTVPPGDTPQGSQCMKGAWASRAAWCSRPWYDAWTGAPLSEPTTTFIAPMSRTMPPALSLSKSSRDTAKLYSPSTGSIAWSRVPRSGWSGCRGKRAVWGPGIPVTLTSTGSTTKKYLFELGSMSLLFSAAILSQLIVTFTGLGPT